MPSYAGAIQAIKDRLTANFTAIPVAFLNGDPVATRDGDGNPTPWALLEIRGTSGDDLRTIAVSRASSYGPSISCSGRMCSRPVGSGDSANARNLRRADRQRLPAMRLFYDSDGPRTAFENPHAKRRHGGDSGSDDGLWYRVSRCSVDGEYWHQA
jgi:hypothetical protein